MRRWRTVHKRAGLARRRIEARKQFQRALQYAESPRFKALDDDIQEYVIRLLLEMPGRYWLRYAHQ